MLQLCNETVRTLHQLALNGSHQEGVLEETIKGCLHISTSSQVDGAAATYHIHGGTCDIRNTPNCFLEPPSVKDLRAFDWLLLQGVRDHFIVGPTYLYQIEMIKAIPSKVFDHFEHLLANAHLIQEDFTDKWHQAYHKYLRSYMLVTRFELEQ